MLWVGLQCVIVLFPDHTHLLLEAMTMKIIDSIAPFGTYCICLTNVHRSNNHKACKIIFSVLILYVPSTIFQLNRAGSSWVEPVLS